jgi:8-oxo-dGTP pyrophosphatase MutT (NUDIX family)
MPISEHLRAVRAKVGHDLLILPAAAGLVFDDAGHVLLLRHGDTGRWVLPGGAVELDETPGDAAVREVWEETGLWVEPTAIRGVFGGPEFRVQYRNGDRTAYVIAVFDCRVRGGELRLDGEEALELRWVAPADIEALDLSPWARIVLPHVTVARGRGWIQPPTWTPPR